MPRASHTSQVPRGHSLHQTKGIAKSPNLNMGWREFTQRDGREPNTFWIPLLEEYFSGIWAVLVSGQVVSQSIAPMGLKVFSPQEDLRIASGGTAAWRPVNPTLGRK